MTNPEIMDLKASRAGPSLSGLSDAEAAERLRTEGYNELPRTGQHTFARIVVDVLREPMLAMLTGLIYMALGPSGSLDTGRVRWGFRSSSPSSRKPAPNERSKLCAT